MWSNFCADFSSFSRICSSAPILLWLLHILARQFTLYVMCVCVYAVAAELKKVKFVCAPHTILALPSIIWLASCISSFCLRFVFREVFDDVAVAVESYIFLFCFSSFVCLSHEQYKKNVSSRRRWNVPANLMLGCIHKMLTTNSYKDKNTHICVRTGRVLSLLDQRHSITERTAK